jgi:hypothetical protein
MIEQKEKGPRRFPMRQSPKKRPLSDVAGEIHKGGLHESLGIPSGEKIPESKIRQAIHSKSHKVRKQAQLAETFKKYRP